MSILTGVAADALRDFGDDFENGTLFVPGVRNSDGQGGFTAGQATPHPCKVLLTSYSDYRRLALGIPATDRLVLVLGASLLAGVIPAKGHQVRAPDPAAGGALQTFDIVAVTGDPASALYKLQAH
jgi:hypothetical protein